LREGNGKEILSSVSQHSIVEKFGGSVKCKRLNHNWSNNWCGLNCDRVASMTELSKCLIPIP